MDEETRFTVKQTAELAGVSARTLHYYDQLGLLQPERDPHNGYRIYRRAHVLRLQQILFLRELDLSLEDIQRLLDQPDYDLLHALEGHKRALQGRLGRLQQLIGTVERTIQYLKGSMTMDAKDLFNGFSEEQQREYEEQVRQRWGEKELKESQRRWGGYSDEQKAQVLAEGRAIYAQLAAAIPFGPASPQAQEGMARWHQHLRSFYEPTPEILLGLAEGYNSDPAFAEVFHQVHPDLAAFMREAVQVYVADLEA